MGCGRCVGESFITISQGFIRLQRVFIGFPGGVKNQSYALILV